MYRLQSNMDLLTCDVSIIVISLTYLFYLILDFYTYAIYLVISDFSLLYLCSVAFCQL